MCPGHGEPCREVEVKKEGKLGNRAVLGISQTKGMRVEGSPMKGYIGLRD